jgi:hypothetical protein
MVRWRWIWSIWIWLIGSLLWAMAAKDAGAGTADALLIGASQMAAVALLAPAIWRLTATVPLALRPATLLPHGAALVLFCLTYTAMQTLAWMRDHSLWDSLTAVLTGPVASWNFLIGGFLYLAIASVSYARRAEHARAEIRVAARDAQLAALSAQLQPHFLFNALHTVGALLRTDPERADKALDDLGQLLRYALQHPAEDVTLAREWDFARDYLAFEDLRLGTRLRLDVRIDETVMGTRVPPFLLQPLLENAVRHGVAASPEGGDLSIHIAGEQDTVRIVIRNSVPENGTAATGMAGTGLKRLRERLELTYGPDKAAVTATDAPGAFVVSVTVPR